MVVLMYHSAALRADRRHLRYSGLPRRPPAWTEQPSAGRPCRAAWSCC